MKVSNSIFKRIIRQTLSYWPYYILLSLIAGISVALSLANPMLFKILIDRAAPEKNFGLLSIVIISIVLLPIVLGIFGMLRDYIQFRFAKRVALKLRDQVFQHLLSLDLLFYSRMRTGELISRFDNDISRFAGLFYASIPDIWIEGITLLSVFAVILYLNWQLALLILPSAAIYLFVTRYFNPRIQNKINKILERTADVLSYLQERFHAIKLIQACCRQNWERKRHYEVTEQMINTEVSATMYQDIYKTCVDFLTGMGGMLVLGYGGYLVLRGKMTIGTLVAFYAYVMRLTGHIDSLAAKNAQIQEHLAAGKRTYEILDEKTPIYNHPDAVSLPQMEDGVSFQDVRFNFPRKEEVIKGISFDVKLGESIALVGRSGAGKTTIANLLMRFYGPTHGKITIDGIDLRKIDLECLRKIVGIVDQETFLFSGTIAENIAYGNSEPEFSKIVQCATAANIHDWIMSLPRSYETQVGEKGSQLSAGQKQRIAIARTLLRNPQIVILDEATSALDAESESKIQEALEALLKDRTSIIIAHRLSTVQKVDRILVIDEGRIIEQGTHEELMLKGGFYSHLCQMQLLSSVQNAKTEVETQA